MTLDDDICYRAIQRRDPRFDGRFFTAVRTTGIYCRPICPARTPKRDNVIFVPSAAAAELAGFRACRRCRPESAPGSPAWAGVGATLTRALRLIEAGALDDGSVEALADRLGVSARHLRRLFTDHLGASPKAIAQTHRLHLARRLVETTDLAMTDVAEAAGFRSLRRFNDAFASAFAQAPGAIRRAADRTDPAPADRSAALTVLRLTLNTRPPFDRDFMFRFLAQRTLPGLERGDAHAYARVIDGPAGPALVRVTPALETNGVEAELRLGSTAGVRDAIARIRHVFDLDADSEAIDAALAGDPDLGAQIGRRPGIRVPGGPVPFEFTVRAVIGQQISVKGARTIAGRLLERAGTPLPPALRGQMDGLAIAFPTPTALFEAELDGIGLTTRRVATLKAVARAFLDEAPGLPDLKAIPGIGPWTAHYVAMRALGEPDAFPDKDLGFLKALGLSASGPDTKTLQARAETWRPYRAYAAMRLWARLEAQP